MLSLDLTLHHPGSRGAHGLELLESLHIAGCSPPPLPQLKFPAFLRERKGVIKFERKSLPSRIPCWLEPAPSLPGSWADWLWEGSPATRPGADGRPAAPRWQVGPGPPAPPPPPCVSSRQTLRFARRSGAPRSAGAGLPGLGHEEPQVPPVEEAGLRARPRAVRRRRRRLPSAR